MNSSENNMERILTKLPIQTFTLNAENLYHKQRLLFIKARLNYFASHTFHADILSELYTRLQHYMKKYSGKH